MNASASSCLPRHAYGMVASEHSTPGSRDSHKGFRFRDLGGSHRTRAQALRNMLGPIRMEVVTPDLGRHFYRAITSLDALALIETPPAGAEGGSNSLQRWRRRELNPRFVPAVPDCP